VLLVAAVDQSLQGLQPHPCPVAVAAAVVVGVAVPQLQPLSSLSLSWSLLQVKLVQQQCGIKQETALSRPALP